MSEITGITEAIDTMMRAQGRILDSIRVETELHARIKTQKAIIDVALGYIQSGRTDLAALVLDGQEAEI
jgi:hypothetical protein